MSRKEALKRLRPAKITTDQKYDLYEQYLEDEEEYSALTGLEKLDTAISDLTEEVNVANPKG